MASPVGQNVLLSVARKTASKLSNKDLIHRLKITSLKQSRYKAVVAQSMEVDQFNIYDFAWLVLGPKDNVTFHPN